MLYHCTPTSCSIMMRKDGMGGRKKEIFSFCPKRTPVLPPSFPSLDEVIFFLVCWFLDFLVLPYIPLHRSHTNTIETEKQQKQAKTKLCTPSSSSPPPERKENLLSLPFLFSAPVFIRSLFFHFLGRLFRRDDDP